MNVEDLKQLAHAAIDDKADETINVSKHILANPEPGYREYKTAELVGGEFRKLGMNFRDGIAVTGLKAILDTGKPGPTIGVIGELDSHIVKGHLHADPETDAAHACGHHTQIGMMLSVAMGLKASGLLEELSGRIALMAVPAEEYIEIEYRNQLRSEGSLEFLTGKSEFIRLGEFDDVDMAMMTHTHDFDFAGKSGVKFTVGDTTNGMVAKLIKFTGLSSHAGGAPHQGINALNAATLALNAIHAQRETFREEDAIRVHPIITRGGGAVSAVPDDVRIETFVRGKTIEAVLSAAQKVDRALKSGALAVGADVSITTIPGYLPMNMDPMFQQMYVENAVKMVGEKGISETVSHVTGSTDMGDLGNIMPVIHPFVLSSSGKAHGVDYIVEDYELAVLGSAKLMTSTVIDLLSDGAKRAHKLKDDYQAPLSKQEYLKTIRLFASDEHFSPNSIV